MFKGFTKNVLYGYASLLLVGTISHLLLYHSGTYLATKQVNVTQSKLLLYKNITLFKSTVFWSEVDMYTNIFFLFPSNY